LWFEQVADLTERAPERVKRSGFGLAQVCLDLGEGLFNWIKKLWGHGEDSASSSVESAKGAPHHATAQ
jgi:hypothetical protein